MPDTPDRREGRALWSTAFSCGHSRTSLSYDIRTLTDAPASQCWTCGCRDAVSITVFGTEPGDEKIIEEIDLLPDPVTDKSDTRGLVERLPGLIADATPGPWVVEDRGGEEYWFGGSHHAIGANPAAGKWSAIAEGENPADAELIALAPTLAELADAALSCVRRLLDGWEAHPDEATWARREGPGTPHFPQHRSKFVTIPMWPSEVHIIEMVRGEG